MQADGTDEKVLMDQLVKLTKSTVELTPQAQTAKKAYNLAQTTAHVAQTAAHMAHSAVHHPDTCHPIEEEKSGLAVSAAIGTSKFVTYQ